ncbi:MAG: hypothetical protein ABGX22_26065, partial [Pirellulaceae bacterium]
GEPGRNVGKRVGLVLNSCRGNSHGHDPSERLSYGDRFGSRPRTVYPNHCSEKMFLLFAVTMSV